MFLESDAILQQLGQSTARPGKHVADTSDSSADESEASHSRRRVGSKRTFKLKTVWGANEVGQFFVTGATKPSHIYCRVCRKDVSVLTHGSHEVLRHYQGVKHFARDQRLRLETPGWRVLDFERNPLSESELERRKKHILRGPLVVRDREYPFAEELIVDETGALDATLPVVAKVSSLIEILRLGGPYELVSQLWSHFTLDAAGPDIAVVSLLAGPHVLAEAFASYLGSGYQAKLIEHPIFDLRLLKRCLQRTASSVFGSLDPFSLTEFVVNRLKGAETRNWMASRPALRNAIITNNLSMPDLVNVVANIVGVWPLIVSYLNETGRKDERDNLVVRSFPEGNLPA